MNTSRRDTGGKLPAGLTPIINTTGKPIMIKPKKTWFDHMIDAFKDAFTAPFKPKRKPIVKVRRNDVSIDGTLTVKSWKWECRICKQSWWSLRWWTTQNSATRHAHNHHRSQK